MKNYITQYQSANLSDQNIIDHFVVRKNEFNKVISDIRDTKKGSSFQHYVYVGRRGSGKSTLLRRIQAEINTDTKLAEKYIAVNLGEEQSGIYKLYDLWDYVLRDFKVIGIEIPTINFREYKNDMKAYTKKLHGAIIDILVNKNKGLVLLVDNIDRIFKNMGKDTALLRELLMNYKNIRIIGGSTYMSEAFWKYDVPFYQYFTIRELKALTIVEIQTLLHHWSIVKKLPEINELVQKHPGKIQSIRMMTDGTPRTMQLFVDMLINRPEQHGYSYLQAIVDKATPIYQERLGTLSPAQQKVITELSFFWEAASVDQLIERCKMEGKTISALLNQLHGLKYIEKIKGKTKNLFYRLEERFFNLWLIMTQGGPQQRQEAKYLTHFLETWYDKEQLHQLSTQFLNEINPETSKKDYLTTMSNALLHSTVLEPGVKQNLYVKLRLEHGVSEELIGKHSEYFDDINENIGKAFDEKNYIGAIELLNVMDSGNGLKEYGLGMANVGLSNYKKAEEFYLLAIDKGHIVTIYNLAYLYKKQGELIKAEKFYLQAIDKGHIDAIYNLANLYREQGELIKAEEFYLLAIEKGNLVAINNLANLYSEQGEKIKAEEFYLLAIDKGHIDAINNLAILYYIENEKLKLKDLIINKYRGEGNVFSPVFLIVALNYIGDMESFSINLKKYISSLEDEIPTESLFRELLIHKQPAKVKQLFSLFPEAIEQYRPLYYASLSFSDDNDIALLKMPPELEESVGDILDFIQKRKEFYYG